MTIPDIIALPLMLGATVMNLYVFYRKIKLHRHKEDWEY